MPKFKVGDIVQADGLIFEILEYGHETGLQEDGYKVVFIEGDNFWEKGETIHFSFSSIDGYDYAHEYMAAKKFDEDLEDLLEE